MPMSFSNSRKPDESIKIIIDKVPTVMALVSLIVFFIIAILFLSTLMGVSALTRPKWDLEFSDTEM